MSETQIVITAARRKFVTDLFAHLLGRQGRPSELEHWTQILSTGRPEREVFELFVGSKEYRIRNKIVPGFPSGHFYSPVVDPEEVRRYWQQSASLQAKDLQGLRLDLEAMTELWFQSEDCIRVAPFTNEAGGTSRYYYKDGRYPKGDAIVLLSMINIARPKHIIEIGSGFSTAAMLDIADLLDLQKIRLTCIDPYADRLRSLMRPEDYLKVEIREEPVQEVSLTIFSTLERDDILFIDSSHVLKTGSDVHFELFSILPALKPGVLVHFHDIQFPFEYPKEWVFGKRLSWNEIYAVRAFLMYNKAFEVVFFTDYFIKKCSPVISALFPDMNGFVGGSLWLRRSELTPERD